MPMELITKWYKYKYRTEHLINYMDNEYSQTRQMTLYEFFSFYYYCKKFYSKYNPYHRKVLFYEYLIPTYISVKQQSNCLIFVDDCYMESINTFLKSYLSAEWIYENKDTFKNAVDKLEQDLQYLIDNNFKYKILDEPEIFKKSYLYKALNELKYLSYACIYDGKFKATVYHQEIDYQTLKPYGYSKVYYPSGVVEYRMSYGYTKEQVYYIHVKNRELKMEGYTLGMRVDARRHSVSYNLMVNINFPENEYKSGKFVGDFILENTNGDDSRKNELKYFLDMDSSTKRLRIKYFNKNKNYHDWYRHHKDNIFHVPEFNFVIYSAEEEGAL